MKYNIETINEYVAKGLLDKCDHQELPISIYKYSRNCQFEWNWDNVTMNMRGTVLDTEGNVVAKTFPKFFNIESDNFPNLPFEVFEKLDGCCHEETLVLTECGEMTIKEICDSKYTGMVMSFNILDGTFEYNRVLGSSILDNSNDWYEIETYSGSVLKLTGNHKIWSVDSKSYIRVDELNGSEKLIFFDKND
jgi:hypothetical protein